MLPSTTTSIITTSIVNDSSDITYSLLFTIYVPSDIAKHNYYYKKYDDIFNDFHPNILLHYHLHISPKQFQERTYQDDQ
jgi:hypothetical protein